MTDSRSILVLLSARGGGDRPPVIALACGLRDRGHQVSILCDSATEQFVSSTGLATITIPSTLDKRGSVKRWFQTLNAEGGEKDGSTFNPLIEWAERVLSFGNTAASDLKPDLIISSLFCMGLAEGLASDLDIPWCFVNPSFYFGDYSKRKWEEDWFGPFIPRLAKECFLPLSQRADIVLHATARIFDFQPAQLPSNHHYVGFLLWEPINDLPEFLSETGDPWALVTTSTEPQQDEIILVRSAIKALSERPVRNLVTLPNKQARQELGEIPNNTTLVGFVPHTPVLQQSAIAVSHAGHGLVSKCLYYGVPMVLLPWDRDQPGVAARAKLLGVAQVVPRSEVRLDTVRQAVATVLDKPEYAETANRISTQLKRNDAIDVACQLLEGL